MITGEVDEQDETDGTATPSPKTEKSFANSLIVSMMLVIVAIVFIV